MGFEVIVSADSQMEIKEAVEWYESQSPSLGIRFAKEAEEMFYQLAQHPQHYSYGKYGFRKVRFPSFPYKIYFKIKSSTVIVFGVLHTGRNPKIIFKRSAR